MRTLLAISLILFTLVTFTDVIAKSSTQEAPPADAFGVYFTDNCDALITEAELIQAKADEDAMNMVDMH